MRRIQQSSVFLAWLALAGGTGSARADELLYAYEGDVLPYDDAAGWIIANPCSAPCVESLHNAFFRLLWPSGTDRVNYHYWIARSLELPPQPPFWVEWRFRSNKPLGPFGGGCDASVVIDYLGIHELIDLDGDAVVSFSGANYVLGLPLYEFQTHRFETIDGFEFRFSVNGRAYYESWTTWSGNQSHYLQIYGSGGCNSDQIPNQMNEWDFVRFGTISYGEPIVASDPPQGFLDARIHAPLDRFTVTFDEPNYVYIDEIGVTLRGGGLAQDVPAVSATRRRDNGPPDEVEIMLDRPIPYNTSTRFVFDDGGAINIVEFTFAPGDTDGDGQATHADFAWLQNCFGHDLATEGNRTISAFAPSMNDSDPPFGILDSPFAIPLGPCLVLDNDADGLIDLDDLAAFLSHLSDSQP